MFVFAGHAVSNASRPSHSYLVLAPSPDGPDSGLLFAKDLEGHQFRNLKFVVLSACSTLGARTSRSSGLAGMAHPFFDAGVQVVVASLWRLDDRPTASLTSTFYRLIAEGWLPAAALRKSQLEVIKHAGDIWRDAKVWSAFEVVNAAAAPKL
jgi:CHAT domain-containing protein